MDGDVEPSDRGDNAASSTTQADRVNGTEAVEEAIYEDSGDAKDARVAESGEEQRTSVGDEPRDPAIVLKSGGTLEEIPQNVPTGGNGAADASGVHRSSEKNSSSLADIGMTRADDDSMSSESGQRALLGQENGDKKPVTELQESVGIGESSSSEAAETERVAENEELAEQCSSSPHLSVESVSPGNPQSVSDVVSLHSDRLIGRESDHVYDEVSLSDPGGTSVVENSGRANDGAVPSAGEAMQPSSSDSDGNGGGDGRSDGGEILTSVGEVSSDPSVAQGNESTAERVSSTSSLKSDAREIGRQSEPPANYTVDRQAATPSQRYSQSLPQRIEMLDQNGSFFESQQHSGNFETSLYPQGNYPNLAKVLPKTSPELMHVIDSAIQETDLSSLQKLQRLVAGKEILVQARKGSGDQDNVAGQVVDVLLAKMGIDSSQKTNEDSPPKIMLSAGAAFVAGKLLPWLPSQGQYPAPLSARTRMAKGLALVLQSCTRNRAMCSAAGLLQVLLETVRDIMTSKEQIDNTWDSRPLLGAVEALGSHSLCVTDLRDWLNTVVVAIPFGKAKDLVVSLERAMLGEETRGPSFTFQFDGESSGLLGPSESRWPFVNGYVVATWLYIESFADTVNTAAAAAAIAAAAAAKTGKSSAMSAAAAASALAGEGMAHMPRLFSFLSADNHGVEAYFHGQFLVVETANGRGKKASMHFTHAFKPRQWYFVALEHTYKQSLLGKSDSEVRLYVDGQLYEARPLEYPRVSMALGFCCIGTNPPPAIAGLQRRRRQCPLFAEMGPVYIFKEPIGQDKIARLAARGGDILPSFGAGAGVPWFANSEHVFAAATETATLDIELGPQLHLLYHPKLLLGRLCPDASPAGSSGLHRRPAEVLGHVHVAARTRATEALWAMGESGPLALLPMTVAAVDKDTFLPAFGDREMSAAVSLLSAPIIRILALAFQHPGNAEEMARNYSSRLLAYLLGHLISVPAPGFRINGVEQTRTEERDEELVAAVVSLAQAPKNNSNLKVQLYSTLLLDLKLWFRCAYGLQKKLLSTLADLAFTDASTMQQANAVQLLLDGCRRCYWVIPEPDSLHVYSGGLASKPIGEINALVDELLVVVELLVGSAPTSMSESDVSSLVQFMMDCRQPNQVARILHLIYRLIVQPNSSRSSLFAEALLSSGVVEMLFSLLKQEADSGEHPPWAMCTADSANTLKSTLESRPENTGSGSVEDCDTGGSLSKDDNDETSEASGQRGSSGLVSEAVTAATSNNLKDLNSPQALADISRSWLPSLRSDAPGDRKFVGKNLGGISLSISADNASNNFRNVDSGDGIMVGIVSLVGALIAGGFLKLVSFSSAAAFPSGTSAAGHVSSGESGVGIAIGIGTWMMYAIRNAFQAAPKRLLTDSVYSVILNAVVRLEMGTSSRDRLTLYDTGHRFEHIDLLLVLLQSLPFASPTLQHRALQDVLFLACTHPENRAILTSMPEWPEWILEILITNYEVVPGVWGEAFTVVKDVEDIIYSFITIMLEYSMRAKDGWKDIEAIVHCAEWLALIGGSSVGEQRLRREESLPVIKRRLLDGLLDFAARELQLQKMVVATAAAGVAAEGLSPQAAKAEAESVAQLSMSLAENALVVLMLVEDHLRFQCPVNSSTWSKDPMSPRASPRPPVPVGGGQLTESKSLKRVSSGHFTLDGSPRRFTNGVAPGGVSLEVLASMADVNGHISAAAMERLAASTGAEPYDSVRGAFVSYGTCGAELAEGWKQRSRMWYGVGLPAPDSVFGGGGRGWDAWKLAVERDEHAQWVEHSLVRRSISMLQSLLLDDSGPSGGGVGYGGGAGTAFGGAHALQQLLDSDQIFFAMLRMVLLSMREEDAGSCGDEVTEKVALPTELGRKVSRFDPKLPSETLSVLTMRKAKTSLLWCVLAPLITMPLSESRRQRVLVAVCIIYSEVWHAVNWERVALRTRYVEEIIPPFTALLRRWRPLLSGVQAFTDADGQSPLAVEDRALALDAHPREAAVSMISPAWAAAFASPPAAMALAMAAAGVGGGESSSAKAMFAKRDQSWAERKSFRLRTLQKLVESPRPLLQLKEKASAVVGRDQDRVSRIGSGRGLGAVAMATSTQRRNHTDKERAKRWNLMESMNTAWEECSFISADMALELTGKDIPKLQKILSAMVETATSLRSAEVSRRAVAAAADEFGSAVGAHSWRSLTRRLLEIGALFGLLDQIAHPERIYYKLDPFENSMRMRRRLKRNYKGTNHYGAAADYQSPDELELLSNSSKSAEGDAALASTPLPTGAPKLLPEEDVLDDAESYSRHSVEDGVDKKEEGQFGSDVASNDPSDIPLLSDAVHSSVANPSSVSMAAAAPTILTAPKEKLLLEIPGAMVQPLKILRGRFQVTTRRICFMIDDRVQVDESGVPSLVGSDDAQDSVDKYGSDSLGSTAQRNDGAKDRFWPLSVLWEIHSRRYLLRRSALELFMLDRSNYFFNFGTEDNRRDVYKALVHARPPHLYHIFAGTQRPERLLKKTQLMERWARHEISNFEYLMQLNTLAGRSFNDLTQYPIFPWVLADYTSKELNFDDPNVFRDLSKPVGALNPGRLEKFLERYENFDDPVIPKFHYGSHYSSAGTVLYYLVRMEPYSTLAISLQGGKFDHADRMFRDISATWNGVLEDMSDVKELVPELFYMPEILSNTNDLHLGKTQNGEALGNVKLPPWAASPLDFVHKHRLALESEYVSANLHKWIDLVFGYKQRGKEAVAADNVFFYMTYEGAVDIDKINDPLLRKATQDQITYFGQTPSQLLTTPHIPKKPVEEAIHLQTIFCNPKGCKVYVIPNASKLNVPAAKLCVTNDTIVTVGMDAPACHIAQHRWQPNTPDGRGTPFVFHHGRPNPRVSSGSFLRMFGGNSSAGSVEPEYPCSISIAAGGINPGMIVAITADCRHLVTGGHADNTLKVVATENARVVESASSHCAPITCLASSSDGSIVVTGSRDATAMLWRIHGNAGSGTVSDSTPVAATSSLGSAVPEGIDAGSGVDGRKRRIEGPLHILRGHADELTCCCINADLDVVVTSSISSGVLLHSITRGRVLLRLPVDRADLLAISSEGNIVLWNKIDRTVHAFTINGIAIAVKQFSDVESGISSMIVSADGLHLVVATTHTQPTDIDCVRHGKDLSQAAHIYEKFPPTDTAIVLVKLHSLEVIHQFRLQDGQEVTSLAMNNENTNLVVSTASGQLLVLTDPALSVKVVDQMLRLGWEGGGLASFLS